MNREIERALDSAVEQIKDVYERSARTGVYKVFVFHPDYAAGKLWADYLTLKLERRDLVVMSLNPKDHVRVTQETNVAANHKLLFVVAEFEVVADISKRMAEALIAGLGAVLLECKLAPQLHQLFIDSRIGMQKEPINA